MINSFTVPAYLDCTQTKRAVDSAWGNRSGENNILVTQMDSFVVLRD